MTRFVAVVLTWSLALGATPATAQDYTPFLDSLSGRVEQAMKAENVPGASIAIVAHDRILWSRAFGVTDLSRPTPIDETTLFSVQSDSKTYTTVAFLRAVERGEIALDDQLVKFYPTFAMNSRDGAAEPRRITFRQLLSHWAGLPHEAPLGGNYDERYTTLDEHIASLSDSWMKARAGERYSYSNVGIDLVGFVLQRLSRKPFAQVMKAEVFDPLGMENSTFDYAAATDRENFARGHIEGRVVPRLRIPMQPSGGLYSTATDLAKFVRFALHPSDERFLSANAIREMARIQYPVAGQQAGYGLGLEIGRLRGARVLRHGGSGYGYSSMQAWLPDYGIGVVVLANAGDVSFSDALAHEILGKMLAVANPPAAASRPAVRKSPVRRDALQTFAGNYKTYGRVVSLAVEGDDLVLTRGNSKTTFVHTGANVFAAENGEELRFTVDRRGNVVRVLALGDHGVDTWFLNDERDEPKGTFRPEWNVYVGSYRMGAYGNEFETTISERNGYLISSRNGGTKLFPFGDGLFFTADGESVVFLKDKMLFGNRPAIKITADPAPPPCEGFPAAEWTAWSSPNEAGWSTDRLHQAREYAESIGSAAGMIVYDGKLLYEWGETRRKFNTHSIRKTLLSALFGTSIAKGEVRTSATLEQLRIDNNAPSLSKSERQATVQDLLEATSGVFHPAVYETADMIASKPKRGTHAHGTYWLYSNWDFNALGTIFERVSYSTIFREFKHRIAVPLRMQDYEPNDGEYVDGPESIHPAYPFRMTARDMARFGLLYLRGGSWCGRSILSPDWVRASTTAHHVTTYKNGIGYGYLWWVGVNGLVVPGVNIAQPANYAWGTGGHYILVLPQSNLVFVHRVNTDAPGKRVNDEQFGRLVQMILAAH